MDAVPAPEEMTQHKVGEEKDAMLRSNFETSKLNSCNIRLKTVETLETRL